MQSLFLRIYVPKVAIVPDQLRRPKGNAIKPVREYPLCTCGGYDVPNPRQLTAFYENEKGDRLYTALDIGFRHPFWSEMRAKTLIDALTRVDTNAWISATILHPLERKFSDFLGKQSIGNTLSEYFVVRTAGKRLGEIDSHFLINGLAPDIIDSLKDKYGFDQCHIVPRSALREYLASLFDFNMHHLCQGVGRWDCSPSLVHKLRLNMVIGPVEIARNGQDYFLCEGMPTDADFTMRLAAFVEEETVVLKQLATNEKFQLVQSIGLLSNDELLEVAQRLYGPLRKVKGWKKVKIFPGTPSAAAQLDEDSDCYEVEKHELWALSTKVNEDPYRLEIPLILPDECPRLDRFKM